MIADFRSPGGDARADRADVAQRAVDPNPGILDYPDLRAVLNEHPRPKVRAGMQICARDDHQEFPQDRKHYRRRRQKPAPLRLPQGSLRAVDRQRPEPFGPPAAIAVLTKAPIIRAERSPLAVPRPFLHRVAVVFQP